MARTLPLLTVAAMILGTVILGLARKHLAAVLETWRRDASRGAE